MSDVVHEEPDNETCLVENKMATEAAIMNKCMIDR
jgi:hypothetical protein